MARVGGYLGVVRILVANGARIDEKDENGLTPLHKACFRGSVEAVKLLVQLGHPVDQKGKHGRTPLHFACLGGHPAVVAVLLEYGHPVNVRDQYLVTPLHVACEVGSKDIVLMLLEREAHLNTKDGLDRLPLHNACNRGSVEIVKLLLEHGAKYGDMYHTPLHKACANLQMVKLLLQIGVSLTDKDGRGQTPLHAACKIGDTEVVRVLLDHGAQVNAPADALGLTPLFRACEEGRPVIVRILLEHGADVDPPGVNQRPQRLAITAEVATILLDYNTRTNVLCSCSPRGNHRFVEYCHSHLLKHSEKFELVQSLERHFVKSQAAGFDDYDLPSESFTDLNTFRQECLTELDIMKNAKVDSSRISYFCVLQKNVAALRWPKLNMLSPENLRKKFPIYGNMLNCSYINLPKRKALLKKCVDCLNFTDLPRLPPECMLHLLDFVLDDDLKAILEVCKPQVSMKK